jgi:hypothetical protein
MNDFAPTFEVRQFETDVQSRRAHEDMLAALARVPRGDHGLWRSKDPTTGEWFVTLLDCRADRRSIRAAHRVRAFVRGTETDIHPDVAEALIRRHIEVMLTEVAAGRVHDGTTVQQMRHHGPAGGQFLHSDGSFHPFPEPKGQG